MFDLIVKYTIILTVAVFALKAALFIIYKSRRWQFMDFLYFDRHHFVNATFTKREVQKQLQNRLSIVLLLLLALLSVCFLIRSIG